jgi:hypothetical protein
MYQVIRLGITVREDLCAGRSLSTTLCRINESGGGINRNGSHGESESRMPAFPFGDDS